MYIDSTVFFASDIHLNPNGPLYLLPTEVYPEGLYATSNLLQPSSREEIIWVIKSVASTYGRASEDKNRRGRRIRVVGSGHSWSKIAKSDDIQLSLENYKVFLLLCTIVMKMSSTCSYVRAGTYWHSKVVLKKFPKSIISLSKLNFFLY